MSDKPLKCQHLNENYLICSGLLINSDNDQLYRSQQSKAFVPINELSTSTVVFVVLLKLNVQRVAFTYQTLSVYLDLRQ